MSEIKNLYHHQQLSVLMASGHGLTIEQVHLLGEIESLFNDESTARHKTLEGPAETIDVHRPTRSDHCFLVSLSPGRIEVFDLPRVVEGELLTVVLRDSDYAYRFNAHVAFLEQTDEGNRVVLHLVDAPVQIRVQRPLAASIKVEAAS